MQPEQATFLLNVLLPQIKNESKTTRRVLEAVPAGKSDYKPDPKAKSALELAWHLAHSEVWFMDGVANGEFSQGGGELPAEIKTPADIVAWYDKNFAAGFDRVSTLPPDKLVKVINFYNVFEHPAIMYLNFLVVHSVHHRGQLSTYLRPMGSKVPSIYGGSADEPFEIPTQAASA